MDQSDIKRNQVGLLMVETYATWAGGVIYMLNIIRALNLLEDSKKPEIVLLCGPESPLQDALEIKYPYLKPYKMDNPGLLKRVVRKAQRIITGKSTYYKILPKAVYPYHKSISLGKRPIYWIADFQDHHLPHLFSQTELTNRRKQQQSIAKDDSIVVFSSLDAMNDFKSIYPQNRCTLRLLRFASVLPEFSQIDILALKKKYEVGATYFMSPNQFWEHKNHKVILEAIVLLKKYNLDFQIVFTGGSHDYRNKGYYQSLMEIIEVNEIGRWIKLLGFIDRQDQLCLMKHAHSIIQPSLFEGWSTVVEDTKAMNQFIFLSNIGVHREQMDKNCWFFDPKSAEELANLIRKSMNDFPTIEKIDYSKNIHEFSESVLDVLTVD